MITPRPIVGFSIENRAVWNARKKRMEKSKQHNPLCSDYNADKGRKEDVKHDAQQRKHQKRALLETKRSQDSYENNNEPDYAGAVAKPGSTKMRTKFHLRKEAKLHVQQTKKNKLQSKSKLSRKERKMESQRTLEKKQNKANKTKKKAERDDIEFTQLVNKYKSQMMSETARKKWYE